MAFFLAHNNNLYAAKPGLVTKKGKLPRTFIYFSNFLQSLFLLLSSMVSKMRLAIFKYILISEYMTIFNWQLSSILIVMIIKTDHKYLIFTKHLPEKTFDLSQATQIVKLSLDANVFTNKFQGLHYVKLNPQYIYLLSQIRFIICSVNITNKANIYLSFIKYILIMQSVLSSEFYIIAHVFDIKKQH